MSDKENEILSKVKQMVASQLGKPEGEINPESSFIEDLGADSLDLVEFLFRQAISGGGSRMKDSGVGLVQATMARGPGAKSKIAVFLIRAKGFVE